MSPLTLAVEQIVFARNYTLRLLDTLKPEDWFWQPPGFVTHVAWQVGHLAMAEYRLGLERVRGPRPQDAELIGEDFLRSFGRESAPDPNPANNPSPAAIREIFDRVHQQVLREVPQLDENDLDKPTCKPHPLVKTRLWSLLWCAQHEMSHAGQIGMIRRLRHYPPIW